jgi:glycosyltransferase involved in cell wall biosynthesis
MEALLSMENKEIKISIIIATYNAEKYLLECLNSIVNQSIKSIEVIVIDGGSDDSTLGLLTNSSLTNLKWITEPDQGIYDALNKGIEMAKGKWLYFLGADDRLLPGFSVLAESLKDEDTVYYGNSVAWNEEGKKPSSELIKGAFSPYRLAKYCMNHQSILYPARAFFNNKYLLKYKILADYAFNIRLWGSKEFKKTFYPIDIVLYHMGGLSSQFNDPVFESEKSNLILKHMGFSVYFRYIIRQFKDKIRN